MENQVLEGFFKPEQLVKARETLGLDTADLARFVGVQAEEVERWENGYSLPTLDQLENMATILGVRVEYFLLDTPPVPTHAYFRTTPHPQEAALSIDTRKIVLRFYELCRYQNELEELLDLKARPSVPRLQISDPESLARDLRAILGVGQEPIKDLEKALFRQNIKIFRLDVPGDEFSGLSLWDEYFGPAILVSAKDSYYRRRFTLGHEYAHLVTTSSPIQEATVCDLDWDKEAEAFANRVAAALLIPPHDPALWEFPEHYPNPEPEDLDELVRRFGVSREAVARRLVELNMVSWNLVTKVKDRNLEEPGPLQFRRRSTGWKSRLGEQYLSLAKQAYKRHLISLGKLAEYLEVDPETALEFAEGK